MYLFKNDFEGAIDILNEWEEKLISLELPAQQELNALVNINQTKFLCFAHNQLEEESLQHIQFTKEARNGHPTKNFGHLKSPNLFG